MTDYQKGKIYRIVCNITGLTYYGSTCEPTLARRLANHKSYFKRYTEGKTQHIITSYKVLEGGNYAIVLVELSPCDNKMELHQRERFFIEGNDCVNKIIPIRTIEEYRITNKSQKSEWSIENRIENKEKIQIRKVKYRIKNKKKLKIDKARYYFENKEKIKAQINLKNKEARLDKINIPII
jgi:hypothetical protein